MREDRAPLPARLSLEILDVTIFDVTSTASTSYGAGTEIRLQVRWLDDPQVEAEALPFVITRVEVERWVRAPGGALYEDADPLLAEHLRRVVQARYATNVALAIDNFRLKRLEELAEGVLDDVRDLVAAE